MRLHLLVSMNLQIYKLKKTVMWRWSKKLLTFWQTLNTDKKTKHLSIFFISCTNKSLLSQVLLFTRYGHNITTTNCFFSIYENVS